MSIELPELPYGRDALTPHMSAKTMDFHYGKHHAGYVTKLNAAVKGTPLADASLEQIIETARHEDNAGVFNNAAQIWNHSFFWNSMSPNGGGAPKGALLAAIDESFGSVEAFREKFTAAATGLFGSGWAWLVVQDGKLVITTTANADLTWLDGQTPLLTCDVWEHAYYLDHQNDRAAFVRAFLNHLVNWTFAADNLSAAAR